MKYIIFVASLFAAYSPALSDDRVQKSVDVHGYIHFDINGEPDACCSCVKASEVETASKTMRAFKSSLGVSHVEHNQIYDSPDGNTWYCPPGISSPPCALLQAVG